MHKAIKTSHGYLRIYAPTHECAGKDGYVYLHHYNWVNSGKKPPKRGEILHHKDGNRQNNHISNLQLLTRSTHASHHARRAPRSERGLFVKKIDR